MKRLNLLQGTPEWHAHRRTARNASEAAAMLGLSPYMTRTELLTIMKTGIRPEPTPMEQERFDKGHRIEAALRPLASAVIGEPLYPVVGDSDDGYLSGSFDGLTMADDIGWECKSLNEELRAVFAQFDLAQDDGSCGRALPIHYQIQMEQDMAISGAEKFLFSSGEIADDGTVLDVKHCWYYPNPELRARILAGWKQFDKDLATFEPQPEPERVIAQPMESLPAVLVNISGALTVKSNLSEYGPLLRQWIDRIPARPSTDQEFADTEAACKRLKALEEALDAEEDRALASIADVQTMRQLKAELRELARTTRLAREKMVDARKKEIRLEIHQEFTKALADHIAQLNATLGFSYMPRCEGNWAEVMKGKKSVSSLREACNVELANCKMAADEVFRRIQQNLNALREHASDYKFLFADTAQLVLKPCDDCLTVIRARITEHKAEEERKEREQREKLEREAREKAEREAEARRVEQARAAAPQQEEAAAAAQRQQMPTTPPAQPAANESPAAVAPVVPLQRAAARGKPTLRLGEIANRMQFGVTEQFLRTLGFAPAAKERSSCLYHEEDFDAICVAVIQHVGTVRAQYRKAA